MTNADSEVTRRLLRIAKKHGIDIPHQKESLDSEQIREELNEKILEECGAWTMPEWRYFKETSYDTDSSHFQVDRSVVGGVGGKEFGICDAIGLVSSLYGAGSINILVPKENGKLSLETGERLLLELLSTEDQIYSFEETYGAVDFERLVYHAYEEEAIYNEIQLQNHSLETVRFSFFVHLAPISSMGLDPIESMHFDESSKILYANNMAAIICSEAPSSVMLSTADSIDIDTYLQEQDARMDKKSSPESGLATALLRYDVELAAAEKQSFYFVSPLKKTVANENQDHKLNDSVRVDTVERWFEFLSSICVDEIPDNELTLALSQAKAREAIEISSLLHSDENNQETIHLDSEKVRAILALARMNPGGFMQDIFEKIIDKAKSESKKAELVEPSVVWLVLKLSSYKHPSFSEGDLQDLIQRWYNVLLEHVVPQYNADDDEGLSVGDIHEKNLLQEQHESARISNEDAFERINETLWSWAALDEMRQHLKDEEKSKKLEDGARRLQNRLRKNLSRIQDEYENTESQARNRFYWITKSAADIAIVKPDGLNLNVIDSIIESHLQRALKVPICHHSTDDAQGNHLLRIASYYAYRKRRRLVMRILNQVMSNLNAFHQVPNTIAGEGTRCLHPRDGSIGTAADLILLTQTMLLSEQNGKLLVFPSIKEEWYASREPMLISDIPSAYGRVTLEVGTSTNQHQLEIALTRLPEEILIFVPRSFSISMAKSFGGTIIERVDDESNPYLRVIPLTNSVVLAFPK